jgi:hypothetical protein
MQRGLPRVSIRVGTEVSDDDDDDDCVGSALTTLVLER